MEGTAVSSMDIQDILARLPHRYPFILLDKVLECVPGKSLTALKNVTINEPFFQGHFPGQPVMPGVLILEALAQATGLLVFNTWPELAENSLYLFVGVDKCRFRRLVRPGDQLILEVSLKREKRRIGFFNAKASVNGDPVTTAELLGTVQDLSVDSQNSNN